MAPGTPVIITMTTVNGSDAAGLFTQGHGDGRCHGFWHKRNRYLLIQAKQMT